MIYRMNLPLTEQDARTLRTGDCVYLTGVLYTARDAAHKRMHEALAAGKDLPVDLRGQTIYYMGPSPSRPGQVIGSAGPTTASRMDRYAPELLNRGLRCMIGKGRRSDAVKEAVVRNGGVYLAAIGGAGALLSECMTGARVVAYEDLGTEAIRYLEVKDFPAFVILDTVGGDLYRQVEQEGQKK